MGFAFCLVLRQVARARNIFMTKLKGPTAPEPGLVWMQEREVIPRLPCCEDDTSLKDLSCWCKTLEKKHENMEAVLPRRAEH